MKLHCQVVRYLSTHGHDDTARLLQVDNVEHTLEGELVEVETVAHVVVRRNGFGVIVNHDGLVAQLAGSLNQAQPLIFHSYNSSHHNLERHTSCRGSSSVPDVRKPPY